MTQLPTEVDVLIVGAGFAGMYAIHRFRGLGLSLCAIEAGTDVGGTWYWNRYPGARCDIESLSYSYSFSEELQQDWHWEYRYATQPEILRYANHVADRFDLRRDIVFGTRLTAAAWDANAGAWDATTDKGDRVRARFLIMATGCLSVPTDPDLPGLAEFAGEVLRTSTWPPEGVDFTGRRVGIIGTGSSAIQSIPLIAAQAEQLTVFQRTPNFSIPAWNEPMPADKERRIKSHYAELRDKSRHSYAGDYAEEYVISILDMTPDAREAEFERRWAEGGFNFQYPFTDLMVNEEANRLAVDFVHRKIRQIVKDPATADLLCPKHHPLGSKRLCVDTDYYQTYNRDNVTLVDIRSTPIETLNAGGLRTGTASYEFDALVLATGFDAMTGALLKPEITGKGGQSLRQAWAEGAKTYLGLAVAGFPNMFAITGPGSPSVLANMIPAIEQHVDFVADFIADAGARGARVIEAQEQAQEDWTAQVTASAEQTLYPQANSWYLGVNVPGKPRVFMPYVDGFSTYCDTCDEIAGDGYRGFVTA